jgi:hypothetical protein
MVNGKKFPQEKYGETNVDNTARRKILIDKDGVLNLYDGWKGYFEEFPVREGVKDFLQSLYNNDWVLVLFTCAPIESTQKWLEENDLAQFFDHITQTKEPASVYLDDRALKFDGNFQQTLIDIEVFHTFWDVTNTADGWIKQST